SVAFNRPISHHDVILGGDGAPPASQICTRHQHRCRDSRLRPEYRIPKHLLERILPLSHRSAAPESSPSFVLATTMRYAPCLTLRSSETSRQESNGCRFSMPIGRSR